MMSKKPPLDQRNGFVAADGGRVGPSHPHPSWSVERLCDDTELVFQCKIPAVACEMQYELKRRCR